MIRASSLTLVLGAWLAARSIAAQEPASPVPWRVVSVDAAGGVVKARGERLLVKRVPKTVVRQENRSIERDGKTEVVTLSVPRPVVERVVESVDYEAEWKAGPGAWLVVDGKRADAKEALGRLKPGDHVLHSTTALGPAWRAVLRPGCVVLISTSPPTADGHLTAEERGLIDAVNAARKEAMLPPLDIDHTLMKAARDHSAEMARRRELNHVFDAKGPQERLAELKHDSRAFGENVAQGQSTSVEALETWMSSQVHKDNILSPTFARLGAAVAADADGVRYWTLVFSGPRE
jgi:uncharacterized protein YkwD